jgi:hypothetical protein
LRAPLADPPERPSPRSESRPAARSADHAGELKTAASPPKAAPAEVRIGTVEIVLASDPPRAARPASATIVAFDEYESLRTYC